MTQNILISSTLIILDSLDLKSEEKEDHIGRPYIEARGFAELLDIKKIATKILESLGFDDIAVTALQEMRDIYDEFSVNDHDGEVYLGDGVYVTKYGDIL